MRLSLNSCTTSVATTPAQIRVALYTRVSTKDKGQETANQGVQLREFCKTQGWMIVCEYEDHDSGSKTDRARFQAMMADAAQRRFDVLVFWALDRLTREGALETLQHLNRLSSYGVGFRSFTEPYLDSCGIFKDAVIAILGTIAKQERIRISERVRAGLNRAKSEGTKSGTRSVGQEQYSRAIKRTNYELKVGLGAGSHEGLASAQRVCAELVNVQGRLHRCAITFRKG